IRRAHALRRAAPRVDHDPQRRATDPRAHRGEPVHRGGRSHDAGAARRRGRGARARGRVRSHAPRAAGGAVVPRARGEPHEGIVTSMADAVVTTDKDLRITALNPAAARLTGWRIGDTAPGASAEPGTGVTKEIVRT